MQMQALYTNEKCLAHLSHLDSLNEFYLRKLYSENDNGASFSELTSRMQSLYNSNAKSFYLTVFAPVARMPVAAVFPADESWYRGEIVDVNPDELSCRVLFVDFGNVEKIPLDRLRYLTKDIIIDDVRVSWTSFISALTAKILTLRSVRVAPSPYRITIKIRYYTVAATLQLGCDADGCGSGTLRVRTEP